ncbi:MAG: hypothetical protein R3335_10955 [Anaerolineales bacterium]|nr:hypothetical protein [Anaerolineales bacterium]
MNKMLGRMMSMLMFASAWLIPISTMLTGAIIGWNPVALFVVSGLLMTAITLLALLNPAVRSMDERVAASPAVGN